MVKVNCEDLLTSKNISLDSNGIKTWLESFPDDIDKEKIDIDKQTIQEHCLARYRLIDEIKKQLLSKSNGDLIPLINENFIMVVVARIKPFKMPDDFDKFINYAEKLKQVIDKLTNNLGKIEFNNAIINLDQTKYYKITIDYLISHISKNREMYGFSVVKTDFLDKLENILQQLDGNEYIEKIKTSIKQQLIYDFYTEGEKDDI